MTGEKLVKYLKRKNKLFIYFCYYRSELALINKYSENLYQNVIIFFYRSQIFITFNVQKLKQSQTNTA